jgi:hypothetical protein
MQRLKGTNHLLVSYYLRFNIMVWGLKYERIRKYYKIIISASPVADSKENIVQTIVIDA